PQTGKRGQAAAPRDIREEQDTVSLSPPWSVAYSVAGVASRGGRRMSGASCPRVNLAPGGCADIIGGTPARVPLCESPYACTPSHAGGLFVLLSPPAPEAAMTPRKNKTLRQPPGPEPLHKTNPRAAGIDIHAAIHWVAVAPELAPPPPPEHPPNLP